MAVFESLKFRRDLKGGHALLVAVSGLVAGFVLIAWIVLVGLRWYKYWCEAFEKVASPADPPTFSDFAADTCRLNDESSPDATGVLLDFATKLYEELTQATKGIEAKATTLLGFVGGGASLYALAVETKTASASAYTPLIGLSILFFLGCLAASLACLTALRQKGTDRLEDLLSINTLNSGTITKSRVSAYLFLLVADRFSSFRKINMFKALWIEAAQLMFAFGAACLVLNYTTLALTAKPAQLGSPSRIYCALHGHTGRAIMDCLVFGPPRRDATS
jgi:hypothetical protein